MAKQCRVNKGNSSSEKKPDKLVMDLFSPGMTAMHRAGLGGLACSLKYIERARANLDKTMIPGEPWEGNKPPWEITDRSITLNFGKPENAAQYLKRLFKASFQIKDGLIYLPGMFGASGCPVELLSELQSAILTTFLSHIPSSGIRENDKATATYDFDGIKMQYNFIKYQCYKHQAWYSLKRNGKTIEKKPIFISDDGTLTQSTSPFDSALYPGAVARHYKYEKRTLCQAEPEYLIPLYFALVGTIPFRYFRGGKGSKHLTPMGVVVVPHIENLLSFTNERIWMNPQRIDECQVGSASDAVLQIMVRLRIKSLLSGSLVKGCSAMIFKKCGWDNQRIPRTGEFVVINTSENELKLFEIALNSFPPTIVSHEISEGKGKNRTTRIEHFWTDSRIRPLIADNLAAGKPWYSGFRSLVVSKDDAETIYRENYTYSKQQPRKGVQAMMEKITWEDPGEETVVRSVHEALRMRFGRIADECRNKPAIMKNRWKGERERWRLAFVGAKTLEQFRHAITDLWSRGGTNSLLRDGWQKVLPMLSPSKWQLTRDLALLAIASYAGKEAEESTENTNN